MQNTLSYFWTVSLRIYNSMQNWLKTTRNALAVMAHFFSATLFLSSSISFLSCLKLFDIDTSKWDEVLACQSLYKQDLRAVSDLKNLKFHHQKYKEWEKKYSHGLLTLKSPVALFTNQTGCAWRLHVADGKSKCPSPTHDEVPTRNWRYSGLIWQLTWASCEMLLFATSSHKLLPLPLQLHGLMWRRKRGNKALIFIWLSSWINSYKIMMPCSQLWAWEAWEPLDLCMCHVKLCC